MMMNRINLSKPLRAIALFFLLFQAQVQAGLTPTTQIPITTAQIIPQTLSGVACMAYNPVAGICFFLKCGVGCSIETSVKVRHRNPDVVISAFPNTGESPWIETRSYTAALGSGLAGIAGFPYDLGGGNDGLGDAENKKHHVSTQFMEAEAVGNPALLMLSAISGSGYMCPSVATPMFPYHLSAADAIGWRFNLIEMFYPYSFIPGLREIGTFPFNTWGAVYPRTGYTTQNEHPKAGAIVAQRSGDIITRTFQPHIYWALGNDCSDGNMECWAPGPLIENNEMTGTFQMLKPYPYPTCDTFGRNDTITPFSWADYNQDHFGDFAWNLWRPYSCCERKGIFLFSIDFINYP